ncbi:U11/U12 small nuclear ribonucleoprotein 48 kDa protein [Nymphaea colorata]|nr:U11/U12 small nuclear ribonucleoprotein 48 kDa protein [Nymphaea colorata]
MDPSHQASPPAFTFLHPNRNLVPNFAFTHPNPNSNLSFVPQNPNPSFIFAPPPPPPASIPRQAPPDLRATASLLKSLIDHAERTVKEVSDLLHLQKPLAQVQFSSCPYDSRHRMPPEDLFLHYLRCPSAPGNVDPKELPPPSYRSSLKSEPDLPSENHFFGRLEESGEDLCFSLDEEAGYNANFFYRDCPGVVGPPIDADTKRIFTLPPVLSAECVNFGSKELDIKNHRPRFLPSEFWELKREVMGWIDYPARCSFTVHRAVLCLGNLKKVDVKRWIVSNSPLHGIVIDADMRDHLFLLLKLCLRAVSRNADCCMEDISGNCYSDCPVLFESLSWLGSQLTILYGQVNGKLFAMNMVKHSLLGAARSSLLFQIADELEVECHVEDGPVDRPSRIGNYGDQRCPDGGQVLGGEEVYVSRVAAAVAALFERASLEERIKGLRLSGAPSKFQRLTEHAQVSTRADEVRRGRLEYRPIIEHDGLLWQRSQDQDDGRKLKTKEELLAEERDYKRRRMSYRGKKVKRTPVQVLRDIIEDHMDEITRAGGIGCFAKGAEKGVLSLEAISGNTATADIHESQGVSYCASDDRLFVKNDRNVSYVTEEVHLRGVQTSKSYNSQSVSNKGNWGESIHYNHQNSSQKALSKDKHDRSYRSRSPPGVRSAREYLDKYEHGERKDRMDVRTKSMHSSRTGNHSERSHSSSRQRVSNEKGYTGWTIKEDRWSSGMYGGTSSESNTLHMLEDRYDPSLSYNSETYGCDYYGS